MDLPADLLTDIATLQALLCAPEARVAECDAIIERKEAGSSGWRRWLLTSNGHCSPQSPRRLIMTGISCRSRISRPLSRRCMPRMRRLNLRKANRRRGTQTGVPCPNICHASKRLSSQKRGWSAPERLAVRQANSEPMALAFQNLARPSRTAGLNQIAHRRGPQIHREILGKVNPVPDRWPDRVGFQRSRTHHPAHRSWPQEHPLRGP